MVYQYPPLSGGYLVYRSGFTDPLRRTAHTGALSRAFRKECERHKAAPPPMYPPMVYHDQIIRNSLSGDFLFPPKARIRTPLAANLITDLSASPLLLLNFPVKRLPIATSNTDTRTPNSSTGRRKNKTYFFAYVY